MPSLSTPSTAGRCAAAASAPEARRPTPWRPPRHPPRKVARHQDGIPDALLSPHEYRLVVEVFTPPPGTEASMASVLREEAERCPYTARPSTTSPCSSRVTASLHCVRGKAGRLQCAAEAVLGFRQADVGRIGIQGQHLAPAGERRPWPPRRGRAMPKLASSVALARSQSQRAPIAGFGLPVASLRKLRLPRR